MGKEVLVLRSGAVINMETGIPPEYAVHLQHGARGLHASGRREDARTSETEGPRSDRRRERETSAKNWTKSRNPSFSKARAGVVDADGHEPTTGRERASHPKRRARMRDGFK